MMAAHRRRSHVFRERSRSQILECSGLLAWRMLGADLSGAAADIGHAALLPTWILVVQALGETEELEADAAVFLSATATLIKKGFSCCTVMWGAVGSARATSWMHARSPLRFTD